MKGYQSLCNRFMTDVSQIITLHTSHSRLHRGKLERHRGATKNRALHVSRTADPSHSLPGLQLASAAAPPRHTQGR